MRCCSEDLRYVTLKMLGNASKKITLEKITQIDSKLKDLNDLRNELSFLASNCHGDDKPNCPILDELSKN